MEIKLGPFNGMSNTSTEYIAPDKSRPKGYVVDAVNVDFNQLGRLKRRPGYTKVVDCASPDGFYDGSRLYYATGGRLYSAISTAGTLVSTELSGPTLLGRVCFEQTPFGMVISDGSALYSVVDGVYSELVHELEADDYDLNVKSGAGLTTLPAGSKLVMHGARLYSVVRDTVYYSEPYDYYRYRPFSGFMQFDLPVTVFESTPTGVLIGSERLYLMPDDPEAGQLKVLAEDKAVPGSTKHKDGVFFVSEKYGITVYTATGELIYPQKSIVSLPKSARAVLSVVERDGDRVVYTTLKGPAKNYMAASDPST